MEDFCINRRQKQKISYGVTFQDTFTTYGSGELVELVEMGIVRQILYYYCITVLRHTDMPHDSRSRNPLSSSPPVASQKSNQQYAR